MLNSIPDALIIFVRPISLTNNDPDFFFCIDNVNIQFNNHSGLCATMQQQDLWRTSVENGIYMSWEEFSGSMMGLSKPIKTAFQPMNGIDVNLAGLPMATAPSIEYAKLLGLPFCNNTPTCGSILCLAFGKDIQLDEYYAPGSLGSFNLQITLSVYNQTLTDYTGGQYELVILTKNSGMLVLERGTASQYQGLLVKQDVLDTSTQEPYTMHDVKRLVGGSIWDRLWTGIKHLAPKIPGIAKSVLGHFKDENPLANSAHNVLSALGYGKRGGNSKTIDDHLL